MAQRDARRVVLYLAERVPYAELEAALGAHERAAREEAAAPAVRLAGDIAEAVRREDRREDLGAPLTKVECVQA